MNRDASVITLLLLLTSAGCVSGHPLMPTPNLYDRTGGYPASSVSADVRNNQIDLLYVTDRAAEIDGGRPLTRKVLNFWKMPKDYPVEP